MCIRDRRPHKVCEGVTIGMLSHAVPNPATHVLLCLDDQASQMPTSRESMMGSHVTHTIHLSSCETAVLLREAVDFVCEAKRVGGEVFIACRDGCAWSPAIALLYLVQGSEQMSLFEAYNSVRWSFMAMRPQAHLMEAIFSLVLGTSDSSH
eukprot:TRINITY_DN18438_c0_g3_i1.p1 TRINITY_DN18438_c0_g3~~TRINITY_DN18438_c0_g3_i1.p1  ORF type:complete len:151 (+),score=25.88 TRINITY_DN18438_c0_g3_i1:114-566(+)